MKNVLRRAALCAAALALPLAAAGTAQALPNNGGADRGCYLAPENTTYPHGTIKILPDGWLYQCWYGVWRPYPWTSGTTGMHSASTTTVGNLGYA